MYVSDAADLLSCIEQLSSSSSLAVRQAAFAQLNDLYDAFEVRGGLQQFEMNVRSGLPPLEGPGKRRDVGW
jgi:hypothetical protein